MDLTEIAAAAAAADPIQMYQEIDIYRYIEIAKRLLRSYNIDTERGLDQTRKKLNKAGTA